MWCLDSTLHVIRFNIERVAFWNSCPRLCRNSLAHASHNARTRYRYFSMSLVRLFALSMALLGSWGFLVLPWSCLLLVPALCSLSKELSGHLLCFRGVVWELSCSLSLSANMSQIFCQKGLCQRLNIGRHAEFLAMSCDFCNSWHVFPKTTRTWKQSH